MLTMTYLFVCIGLLVAIVGVCLMALHLKSKVEKFKGIDHAKEKLFNFGKSAGEVFDNVKEHLSETKTQTASGSAPTEYTEEDADLLEIVHQLALAYDKTDKYLKG